MHAFGVALVFAVGLMLASCNREGRRDEPASRQVERCVPRIGRDQARGRMLEPSLQADMEPLSPVPGVRIGLRADSKPVLWRCWLL
jgi:hypothetical protein